ncbi:MAG: zinc ABC transporter substrate-binding protein [Tistlia sp.]|uniref:zinc ABC transporter substrate-binding protein n=1 Tax=Tistlia sp. TaxID=3057121 RepID=UPI0034A5A3FB
MTFLRCAATAAFLLSCGSSAAAEAPRVVATIGPLQSLTAAVMAGVGSPALLVPGGASPHAYSLRPSEAAALQAADLVVWIGPALERFLEEGLDSLAPRARRIEVLELAGLTLLEPREGGNWDSHAHDLAGEHSHDEEHDHDDHDEAADGHEGHGEDDHRYGAVDAHVWLDPRNAQTIVQAIAGTLTELDPEHAAVYRDNAAGTVERIEGLRGELAAQLAPVAGRPFVVFHDAYGYFERAFSLNAVGSVTVSPEQQPSARRIAELRTRIRELGAACLFREPQFAPRLVETLSEGGGLRIGVLDPLGADLAPGPEAYPRLLRNLADSLSDCLAGGG